MPRMAVLTGGGDAPGLNAVIRAVVRAATLTYGWEVLGVRDGYDGFLKPHGVFRLTLDDVEDILDRGGTILGAANRGNPFARKVVRDGEEVIIDISDEVVARIHDLGLEAVIVAGGDGTLGIARDLFHKGVPVVGVPKTIDNDVWGTDATFGFDTAVNCAAHALGRLHTTAEAHHRVMVVELMGREAGFITLYGGLSGGADIILIPEIPFRYEVLCKVVQERIRRGHKSSIVAVAEGARPEGGHEIIARPGDAVVVPRLGGIGQVVGKYLEEECGVETRVTVLGHLQRGGSPSAFDRWLATTLAGEAVRLAVQRRFGRVAVLHQRKVTSLPLDEVVAHAKRVDPESDAVRTAREIGICFGDQLPPLPPITSTKAPCEP